MKSVGISVVGHPGIYPPAMRLARLTFGNLPIPIGHPSLYGYPHIIYVHTEETAAPSVVSITRARNAR